MTKARLEHRIERTKRKIDALESIEDRLSEHGKWSLGYWKGILSVLEEWLDDLNEMEEQ